MLCTIEEYAKSHNLKFSTDPNPIKCKTKCMAFLRKVRDLPNMILCGNSLPWVDKITHLGTIVTNRIDGCQEDLKMKTAIYIQKNCSIIQEFSYAHPTTKLRLNSIYNCHFSGSSLWDLFSHSMRAFKSSFNKSVKMMTDLPFETHRYFLESLLGTPHMKLKVLKNYLTFIKSIRMSAKPVLRQLYHIASSDVRSVTGKNLRNILLLTNKLKVKDLSPSDIKSMEYHPVPENDQWRTALLIDLLNFKHGTFEPPWQMEIDELDNLIHMVCTS